MIEKKILGGRESVKVAVVQASPVFMDKAKTIDKACQLIKEAGKNGAELVVFSETFIAGYPAYYTSGWESKPSEWTAYVIALQDNSVVVNSADTEALGEAVRAAGIYAVVGCNELDDRPGSRTVYNTLLFFGRDGKLMGRHRKLMPTFTERTYWGWGDASDLKVFETDIGRIGGLICGENQMILVKAAMMQKGEEFHIAVWPGIWSGHARTNLLDPETDPLRQSGVLYPTIRSYAFDAQSFVLSAHGIITDLPEQWQHLKGNDHASFSWAVGGSAVVNPHGGFIAGPLIGEESILYAECRARNIKIAKALYDCLGHYTRWDVVRLEVRKEPWTPEVASNKPEVKLPQDELRRISQDYEIGVDKLQALIEELNASTTSLREAR